MKPIEMLKAALDQGARIEMDFWDSAYHVEIENDSWRAYGNSRNLEKAINEAWEDFQQ